MLELRRPRARVARVGHRGAAALAPENTLRSLELAVELGCDMLEFDVLALSDGTLVLAHSNSLREVSHGAARGRVRRRTLDALRGVAPNLPTSDEALRVAHEAGAAVYVWTVDDARLAQRLVDAGADGIITNDPRIFSRLN